MSGEAARQISSRVAGLNDALVCSARECGAQVYALCSLFRRVKYEGYNTGARVMTGEYLGGFYSLNGYYPGAAGHACIANELLRFLDSNYQSDFPQINVTSVQQTDPVPAYKPAEGPCWTLDTLPRAQPAPAVATSLTFGDLGPGEPVPSGWE